MEFKFYLSKNTNVTFFIIFGAVFDAFLYADSQQSAFQQIL